MRILRRALLLIQVNAGDCALIIVVIGNYGVGNCWEVRIMWEMGLGLKNSGTVEGE